DISLHLRTYQKYGVWYDTGVTAQQDIVSLCCLVVALIAWSWTCGFVLGSLSGRAVWLTWYMFYLVVLYSTWARFVLSGNIFLRDPRPLRIIMRLALPLPPLDFAGLLFFLCSLCGVLLGLRRRAMTVRRAYMVSLAI